MNKKWLPFHWAKLEVEVEVEFFTTDVQSIKVVAATPQQRQ